MRREESPLPGVCIIHPQVHEDPRGFFLESWHRDRFEAMGIRCSFVQDNHSRSAQGVLRGLHYQLTRPQSKLVRVIEGEVYDVAVDVRRGSPTFGRWTGHRLSAANRRMLFIPEGFAHGFYVVSGPAQCLYKCSDVYVPSDERGVAWNDPEIGIEWPLGGVEPILSGRDRAWKPLSACSPPDLPSVAK